MVRVKGEEKDGYQAVQIGFGEKKNLNKPDKGQGNFRFLREFRLDREEKKDYQPGEKILADVFKPGDKVIVRAVSKGKGFQGVVKRHGFKGAATATHGTKHAHRQPGSIGSTFPERVVKGKKMAGRMGFVKISTRNLRVARVEKEKNLLWVKGSVPGPAQGLVRVSHELL